MSPLEIFLSVFGLLMIGSVIYVVYKNEKTGYRTEECEKIGSHDFRPMRGKTAVMYPDSLRCRRCGRSYIKTPEGRFL